MYCFKMESNHEFLLSYCMQIGYYFILKSQRISVQNHPVIKRLVEFRGLLNQLETKFIAEMDNLLAKVKGLARLHLQSSTEEAVEDLRQTSDCCRR